MRNASKQTQEKHINHQRIKNKVHTLKIICLLLKIDYFHFWTDKATITEIGQRGPNGLDSVNTKALANRLPGV